jgi:curved DNA-binding protein CbpA
MIKNYYRILEINQDSSPEDIKKAFRKKALKYHPDVCKLPNANKLFIEIYEAFEILSDSDKRKKYDELFLLKEEVIKVKKPTYDDNFNEWMNNAKAKAENHSKMKYDKYKRNVFDEIIETSRETISFGWLFTFAILGMLGICGFSIGLSQFLRHERYDYTFIIGLVFLILPAIPFIRALKNRFNKN